MRAPRLVRRRRRIRQVSRRLEAVIARRNYSATGRPLRVDHVPKEDR